MRALPRNGNTLLAILGTSVGLVFAAAFLVPFSVFTLGDEPRTSLAELTGRGVEGIAYFIVALGVPFLLYALGVWVCLRRRVSLAVVMSFTAAIGLVLLFVYPLTAIDVFLYGALAWLFTEHGANPFISAPNAFTENRFLEWAVFTDRPSAYGPLWILLTAPAVLISGGDPMGAALLTKALALIALLISVLIAYLIGERARPGAGAAAALVLGWNPLVLWSTAANGHNDIVMMMFVLLGFLLVQRRPLLAPSALVFGAAVKFAVIVLVPLFFLHLWRRGYGAKKLLFSALGAALCGAALAAPFWAGPDALDSLVGQVGDMASSSPGATLILFGEWAGFPENAAATWARGGAYAAFLLVYVFAALRVRDSVESLMIASFLVLMGVLLLATFWFRFWYIIWVVVLSALLIETRQRMAMVGIAFSGTGLLVYVFTDYTWVWLGFGLANHVALVLTVFAPPLVLWAWLHAASLRRRHAASRPLSLHRVLARE